MSISLPDTNGVLPKFTLNDEPLFTMKWCLTKTRTVPTRSVYLKQREDNFTTENLSVNFGELDGVGFMKTIVNFFKTQRETSTPMFSRDGICFLIHLM